MWKKRILVVALGAAALGAGPCDALDEELDTSADDGGALNCGDANCVDQVTIRIIRADNQQFLAGDYVFTVALADGTQISIDCYLAYLEAGLDCSVGDTDKLAAAINETGDRISLAALGTPETLVAGVAYNGWLIGERNLAPTYETVEPNGAGCPPACWFAEVTMAVESW